MLMSLFGTIAPTLRLPPLWAAGEQGIVINPSAAGTLFQDAAGATPVTAVGQSVGLVLDRSGRANHATQATAAKRPTFQTDAAGRPYLQFDGVDDVIESAAFAWGSGDLTLIAAARREGGAGARQLLAFGDAYTPEPNSFSFRTQSASADPVGYSFVRRAASSGNTLSSAGTYPQTETAVISVVSRFSVADYRMRRNGVAETSVTLSTSASAFGTYPMTIGCRPGGTLFFAGRLYGLLAVNRALTDQELALAERWAARKCGVTI